MTTLRVIQRRRRRHARGPVVWRRPDTKRARGRARPVWASPQAMANSRMELFPTRSFASASRHFIERFASDQHAADFPGAGADNDVQRRRRPALVLPFAWTLPFQPASAEQLVGSNSFLYLSILRQM